MRKDSTIEAVHEIVVQEAQHLFPNGGWDVHHHIFERTYDSLWFNLRLRMLLQPPDFNIPQIDISLHRPHLFNNTLNGSSDWVSQTLFSRTVYLMEMTARLYEPSCQSLARVQPWGLVL